MGILYFLGLEKKTAYEVYLEGARKKGPLITNGTLCFLGSYFKTLSDYDKCVIEKYSKGEAGVSAAERAVYNILDILKSLG